MWAKVCLIVGSLVMVASGIGVIAAKAFSGFVSGAIPQESLLGDGDRKAGKEIVGPQNILLLGMDQRPGSTAQIHTDSIIIAHVNAAHTAVTLVSIPRDTKVEAPAFAESGYRGGLQKLTEVFAVANAKDGHGDPSLAGRQRGVRLLVKTIQNLIPGGIKIDGVALINFTGFDKLVNALGGVDMCVDQRVVSLHYDRDGKYVGDFSTAPRKVYEVGCRHLVPWEALDYVRQRESLPHGDYDRQRHQQQFLFAVFKKLLSKGTLTNPSALIALKDSVGDLLTLDLNGAEVADWVFAMKGIRSSDITMVKTNGGNYNSEKIDGKSYQVLSARSLDLLQAVSTDTVLDFLAQNPSWIAKDT